MRILLTQPKHNHGQPYAEAPSTALLILGTIAEKLGDDVKIIHYDVDRSDIRDDLAEYRPDLVGITCNTFQVKGAKFIAKMAQAFGAKVVIGGVHTPYLINLNDYKPVIGEGENAWLELLMSEKRINNIDDVPIPDYSLIDFDKFCGAAPIGGSLQTAIMASRGCPYSCTFCNTPLWWGKKIRYRDPELVLEEIEELHHSFGVDEVFFQDDTFNINHEWAYKILNSIIEAGLNKEMVFKICCRVNESLLTPEFLELAAKAGVWNIFYGIESGSQQMLDRMKKGITVDEIKRAIKLTHEVGINSQCSFVVGLPGETLQTLRETSSLIKMTKPDTYGWGFWCPFPGTEATKEATSKGYIKHTDYDDYGYGLVLARTDALDFSELEKFQGFEVLS